VLITSLRRRFFPANKLTFYKQFFIRNNELLHLIFPISYDGDTELAKLSWNYVRQLENVEDYLQPKPSAQYADIVRLMTEHAIIKMWVELGQSVYTQDSLLRDEQLIFYLLDSYFFNRGYTTREHAWNFVLEHI
jgi:hypothetical protein